MLSTRKSDPATCSPADFRNLLKSLDLQGQMDVLSRLEREMNREQSRFSALSSTLHDGGGGDGDGDDGSEYEALRQKQLRRSQNRLSMLMERSAECLANRAALDDSSVPRGDGSDEPVAPTGQAKGDNVADKHVRRLQQVFSSPNVPDSENSDVHVYPTRISLSTAVGGGGGDAGQSGEGIMKSTATVFLSSSSSSPQQQKNVQSNGDAAINNQRVPVRDQNENAKNQKLSNTEEEYELSLPSVSARRATFEAKNTETSCYGAKKSVNGIKKSTVNRTAVNRDSFNSSSTIDFPGNRTGETPTNSNGQSSYSNGHSNLFVVRDNRNVAQQKSNSNNDASSVLVNQGLPVNEGSLTEDLNSSHLTSAFKNGISVFEQTPGKGHLEIQNAAISYLPNKQGQQNNLPSNPSNNHRANRTGDSDISSNGFAAGSVQISDGSGAACNNANVNSSVFGFPSDANESIDSYHRYSYSAVNSAEVPNLSHPTSIINNNNDLSNNQSIPSESFLGEDEQISERLTLKHWDPVKIFDELYRLEVIEQQKSAISHYFNLEGYLEKQPSDADGKTLSPYWERKFFRCKDGVVECFEGSFRDKSSCLLNMTGGSVGQIGDRIMCIEDVDGQSLVVRCCSDGDGSEFSSWFAALSSQTNGDSAALFVSPSLKTSPNMSSKTIIVDLGSCSIRAGFLGHQVSLPKFFFPNIMATNNRTGNRVFGARSLSPAVRSCSKISFPIKPVLNVEQFSIDMAAMPDLFHHIFSLFNVNLSEYTLLLSAPGNLGDKLCTSFMDIFIKTFHLKRVKIINQSLLSIYSYDSQTGIVIDIGERTEVVPIADGYILESGVSRQPYGGHKVNEALTLMLAENVNKYQMFSNVEAPIVRFIKEKSCFLSQNFQSDRKKPPQTFSQDVSLAHFDLPDGWWDTVSHSESRYMCTEGLFNTDRWGIDNLPIQKMVQRAVVACPLDLRRRMWRSIFVSGGTTTCPGFLQRLESEVAALAPDNVKVKVHGNPNRMHSAFLGASVMAQLSEFQHSCISREEWLKEGPRLLRRWHMY